jgi:hypothetical protein
MYAAILDKLLTTLSVRLHAFAVCEIQEGYRLGFDPMEAVTIHYILAGNGVVQIGSGTSVSFSPNCVVVVPARTQQSIGDGSFVQLEKVADGTLRNYCGWHSQAHRRGGYAQHSCRIRHDFCYLWRHARFFRASERPHC